MFIQMCVPLKPSAGRLNLGVELTQKKMLCQKVTQQVGYLTHRLWNNFAATLFRLLLGRDHNDLEQWVKKKMVQSCKIV